MEFRLTRSTTRDVQIVEVWHAGKFLATICPLPDDLPALTIVTQHLERVMVDEDGVPVVVVIFGERRD